MDFQAMRSKGGWPGGGGRDLAADLPLWRTRQTKNFAAKTISAFYAI